MPRRAQSVVPTPVKQAQARSLWGMVGGDISPGLTQWDPKSDALIEALLTIVASGATVVMRPGSGGRSLGIAIWEGDERHAPQWSYDAEELDQWASRILAVVDRRGDEAAD